jgi:hypothetical protein
MSTDTTAMIQLAGGAGGFQNLASSTIAQQQEDALRVKYLQNAKSWISEYNNTYDGQIFDESSANWEAAKKAFSTRPEFAIEFNLTDSLGEPVRINQNIKQELMRFFRITG